MLFAVLLSACATNPATGKHEISLMSVEQEIAIGEQQDVQVRKEMGVYSDRTLQDYVSGIGMRLAADSDRPNLPWRFTVVDTPAVNAFALPGGYIYITRGILPYLQDEAQLAGVLGHEIGHVTARHAAQQYSRSIGAELGLLAGAIFVPQTRPFTGLGESGVSVLMLKYSRDDEAQSDALGVKYAARAGWDPAGVPQMLTTLGRIEETSDNKGTPSWLQTHPLAADRVDRVQSAVAEAEQGATSSRPGDSAPRSFITDRAGFTTRLDRLVYGDNPEQGVVRAGTFLHAGLRFAVEFPSTWDVTNGPTQVVAKAPDAAGTLMLLGEIDHPVGGDLEDIALRSMQNAGFRARSGGRTAINSLEAFVGTYDGTTKNLGRVVMRAAHVQLGRAVFLIAGVAPTASFDTVEPHFTRTIDSFRPLTRGEAEAIHPNRIALYTARTGDTWQAIAERAGKGIVKPATLAIINGHAVSEQPRAGERLKIVVSG